MIERHPQDPRNFGLAYRLDADFEQAQRALEALVQQERAVVEAAAPREPEWPGPLVCCHCRRLIRPARAGHEKDPASHGAHPECLDRWRAENGLPRRSR